MSGDRKLSSPLQSSQSHSKQSYGKTLAAEPQTDDSTVLTSTKQDILTHLLKQGQATAQELADCLDITPQAIRRHLKDLETDGLICHQALQSGMGRPTYIYALSPAGRDQFPDRYSDFALSLLDTLTEAVGQEQVGTILQKQWQRKALGYRQQLGNGSLKERVTALVELRRQEGFMAELHIPDADDSGHERFILAEYNCAISHIAESFPAVCGHELELFAVALQDCTIDRTHWLVNGEHRCGYLIQAI